MKYECIFNPELNTVEGATHGKADINKFRAWEIIVAMYELSDFETQVFKTRDDAAEWIKTGP